MEFSNWFGGTIIYWGMGIWTLVLLEYEIVLNDFFFWGTLLIWGILVFIILRIIEYNIYSENAEKESSGVKR